MIPLKPLIASALHGNQFASGGILLMLLGTIGVALKKVPSQIWEWFLHLFSMTLTITDETEAFQWFKWWFQDHQRSKKIRHMDVFTPWVEDGRRAMLFPAPGAHWFMYKKRPIRMTFTRTENKGGAGSDYGNAKRTESLTIRVIGRDQVFLRDLVKQIQERYSSEMKVLKLHIWDGKGNWEDMTFDPRPLDSVILPAEQKKKIVEDLEKFIADKTWYRSVGMPYHRSYLFHGPPGTGKTSFLLGLAAHFKMNAYLLKLSTLGDAGLLSAVQQTSANSMIVLEDVDCVVTKRKGVTKDDKKKKSEDGKASLGVTLSGLLNALDGIETPPGALFFLTTNCIDKLDAALLRPGRVDVKEFIGPATVGQKVEMYQRFFLTSTEKDAMLFLDANPKIKTMAEFQEALKLKRITEGQ